MGGNTVGNRHYSDSDLIDRLYGLGAAGSHLDECEFCGGRWKELLAKREQTREAAPVSEDQLVRQRTAVREAIRSRAGRPWRTYAMAAVTAAALLLAVSLTLTSPGRPPAPVPETASVVSDAELLADVYSAVSVSEPVALDPVRALFEVEQ